MGNNPRAQHVSEERRRIAIDAAIELQDLLISIMDLSTDDGAADGVAPKPIAPAIMRVLARRGTNLARTTIWALDDEVASPDALRKVVEHG